MYRCGRNLFCLISSYQGLERGQPASFERRGTTHGLGQFTRRHRMTYSTSRRWDFGYERCRRGNDKLFRARFVRVTIRARDHTSGDRVGRRAARPSIGNCSDWRRTSSTSYDPWMTHRRSRLHSTVRVPSQAFTDEIDKELVIAFKHLGECFRVRSTSFALGIDKWSRSACRV